MKVKTNHAIILILSICFFSCNNKENSNQDANQKKIAEVKKNNIRDTFPKLTQLLRDTKTGKFSIALSLSEPITDIKKAEEHLTNAISNLEFPNKVNYPGYFATYASYNRMISYYKTNIKPLVTPKKQHYSVRIYPAYDKGLKKIFLVFKGEIVTDDIVTAPPPPSLRSYELIDKAQDGTALKYYFLDNESSDLQPSGDLDKLNQYINDFQDEYFTNADVNKKTKIFFLSESFNFDEYNTIYDDFKNAPLAHSTITSAHLFPSINFSPALMKEVDEGGKGRNLYLIIRDGYVDQYLHGSISNNKNWYNYMDACKNNCP